VSVGTIFRNTHHLMQNPHRRIGSGKVLDVSEGANYQLGNKDIEIDRAVSREEYMSGACFGKGPAMSYPAATSATTLSGAVKNMTLTKKYVPLKQVALNVTRLSASESRGKGVERPSGSTRSLNEGQAEASTVKAAGAGDQYWTANWCVPHMNH
jgi:DNA repair and recombination protein RAD54B